MAAVKGRGARLLRIWRGIKLCFVKEAEGFSDKPSILWRRIAAVVLTGLGIFIIFVLVIAGEQEKVSDFAEKKQVAGSVPQSNVTSTQQRGFNNELGQSGTVSGSASGGGTVNRNTPMVLSRGGDATTQLPPGTKFAVTLADSTSITSQAQPVVGIISQDVFTDYGVAINRGTKIFGEASFDRDRGRAIIQWRTLINENGQSKTVSAIALGSDNLPGVEGEVHSDGIKNTVGALVTRFVGGVAEGSISRNFMGQSTGGIENGLLNGVADTAKEHADLMAEDLKKERAWIELKKGTQAQVILIDNFTYRDPGGVH